MWIRPVAPVERPFERAPPGRAAWERRRQGSIRRRMRPVRQVSVVHLRPNAARAGAAPMTAESQARDIIDSNLYLVLATADASGAPWATPVYFASSRYREFIWVSKPEAQHSRNLGARREVGIVIFDSTLPINTGQAVYVRAVADELVGDDRTPALDVFSQRLSTHGEPAWTVAD